MYQQPNASSAQAPPPMYMEYNQPPMYNMADTQPPSYDAYMPNAMHLAPAPNTIMISQSVNVVPVVPVVPVSVQYPVYPSAMQPTAPPSMSVELQPSNMAGRHDQQDGRTVAALPHKEDNNSRPPRVVFEQGMYFAIIEPGVLISPGEHKCPACNAEGPHKLSTWHRLNKVMKMLVFLPCFWPHLLIFACMRPCIPPFEAQKCRECNQLLVFRNETPSEQRSRMKRERQARERAAKAAKQKK
eukprot:GILK01009994.1.p1 GENE.GILK01009994.1~~GILK01009994.1.p1  ORF type:complete len:242 (+),score=40.65 GILK01009994.1:24-749(+)